MPEDVQIEMIGAALVENGLATDVSSDFVKKAVTLCANGIELVQDATKEVSAILEYPLEANLEDAKMVKIFEDDFGEIADAIVAGFESGELKTAIEGGEFKKIVNATGKTLERKGKRLFMPFRVALTGRMQGPEVGDVLDLLVADGVPETAVSLEKRIETLKAASAAWTK
jgi:glutamyl-tRNA synthetase